MSNGLKISFENDELLIKGKKEDLKELSDYILDIVSSKEENNHIHLDDLTIIDDESNIKNIIIEKEK